MRINVHEKEIFLQEVFLTGYLNLEIQGVKVENNSQGKCSVTVNLGEDNYIEGSSMGVIDAAFRAFSSSDFPDYAFLRDVKLHDFKTVAIKSRATSSVSFDVVEEAIVVFKNTRGNLFEFAHKGKATPLTTVNLLAKAVEFFVNSNRCYIALYRSYRDAIKSGRQELVEKYTMQMADIVDCISFDQALDCIEKESKR